MKVKVIGAGLAGSEAAWQLAQRGIPVRLYEMRPKKSGPAHHTADFAELVCSNSLRSSQLSNAVGLLKEEMRRLGLEVVMLTGDNEKTARAVGRQAGLTLDTITRNVLQSGTNVYYCPEVDADYKRTAKPQPTDRTELTAGCKLTVTVVKRIAALLKAANAPKIGGSYVCILHPYAAYDLTGDPKWEEPHKYCKPEEIFEGEIGRIAGVRFVETSEAAIYTGEENDCPEGLAVFGCLFLADGAYGVTEIQGGGLQTIIKQLGSAGTADPLNQRSTVGWKAMKTAEILMEPYLFRVECCSEFSAEAEAN